MKLPWNPYLEETRLGRGGKQEPGEAKGASPEDRDEPREAGLFWQGWALGAGEKTS